MKEKNFKKVFYNIKEKNIICKDLDFNMHDKRAWISFEEKPSRMEDCYFLGEMRLENCGKFEDYVKEKERTGPRDPEIPGLFTVLKYFNEWKKVNYNQMILKQKL
jgi:hypothetical protein